MERLQKVLARRGVGSRRKCEEYITAGRVEVNGRIVRELGSRVDPHRDEIRFDGQLIAAVAMIYLLFNKPPFCITTREDPGGRPTVMDYLPSSYQDLHPVGRLDWDTEGLLLLTNDGELTYKLTHPRHQVDKTYRIWTDKRVGKEEMEKLRRGIKLEDGWTAPAVVKKISPGLLEISIHEGRNRQVRRMMSALKLAVNRLQRIRMGNLELGDLPAGEFRELSSQEKEQLKALFCSS